MFNFLKGLLKNFKPIQEKSFPIYTGALGDDRTDLQIATAYDAREVITAKPIWKDKVTYRKYPIKYQYFTGECVAQSVTKHLGVNNERETGTYADLSAEFFYWFRSNKPFQGMGWLDTMKIAVTIGSCFNSRIKQRVRETEPEPVITQEMRDEALTYRGADFFEDKVRSMDSIASIIEEKGSCIIWFWFDVAGSEWWNHQPRIIYPTLGTYDDNATRHSLLAVDYTLIDGKKFLVIEDSAGNDYAFNGQNRLISEDFLKRCFVSGIVIDRPNPVEDSKPKWSGAIRDLTIGSSGDDVKELQAILRYEGCFDYPTNTGYFGGLTRAGLIKLQNKYSKEILSPVGLTKGTGYFGLSTRRFIANKFA